MEPVKQGKNITSSDIAKVLGVENDFDNLLFEQEMKETYENFAKSEVDENNIIATSEEQNEPN